MHAASAGRNSMHTQGKCDDEPDDSALVMVSEPEKSIIIVTLNCPRARNALSLTLLKELSRALRLADARSDVSVIVLTGSEKSFSSGFDLKALDSPDFPPSILMDHLDSFISVVKSVQKPLVAAVSGTCLGGGCELAMMCDMVVCTTSARFGLPETKLNLIPGAGGTVLLLRLIGPSRATSLLMTGQEWSGEQAEKWGMASRCVGGYDDMMYEAIALARAVARNGQASTGTLKRMIRTAIELGSNEATGVQREAFGALLARRRENATAAHSKKKQIDQESKDV